ncbi:hypothetical protein ACLMJK_004858 [Lecanora helva]
MSRLFSLCTYHNENAILETLDIFKILVDSEEIDFLEEKSFADAWINLASKISTTGPLMVSVDTETRIVEILFAISSKLRLQPQSLSTWFRPRRDIEHIPANISEQVESEADTATEKDTFPLFYLTLDYVHHDGKVGDFARTGLLYLIELAAHSEALEKWIVEGDLATLMASGLGALYSQLSRKLVLSFAHDSVPAILSFSETEPLHVPRDVDRSNSLDFQAHLRTFLSYLVFWQDILEHCSSSDVKQSLLDHYKLLFLQQLLYPSLIESSDIDGGSSVAVLTYLRCIIESINHLDLLDLTLQYLLALPEKKEEKAAPARPTTLARRRKSSMLVSNLAQGQEKPKPDLFTLVDLVISSLRSCNQQTITSTLQLVSVILRNQHQYAVLSLIRTKVPHKDSRSCSVDLYKRNTGTLFSMAEDLLEHDGLAEAYNSHLVDARTLLESHCCTSQLLVLPGFAVAENPPLQEGENDKCRTVRPHSLDIEDPLLGSLVSLLENFLANDIGTNLRLTQVFSTLASCGYTSLDGWLLGNVYDETVSHASLASDDASEHDDTITLNNVNRMEPQDVPTEALEEPQRSLLVSRVSDGGTSRVFTALENLVRQVDKLRHEIEEFDTYLGERRHVFQVGEDIDQAVANDVPALPKSDKRNSGEWARELKSRNRAVARISSLSERLMSEPSSSDISRSSSPRGRPRGESSSRRLVGQINQLQISPSSSPASSAPEKALSPSPLRKSSPISTSPKQPTSTIGSQGALRQKVKLTVRSGHDSSREKDIVSETGSMRSQSTTAAENEEDKAQYNEVTLSHLLTNVIILQEFILELAAIIEVRASLFGEVSFG